MKKIAFLFPGQGSQAVGMGEEIYKEYDVVREIFDMASELAEKNLSRLCFKGPIEDLTMTINLQPAIMAVNLGFLALIEKESLQPIASAGHSLGEYGALCAAGVISKEDALRLVIRRGELMHRESTKHKGAMHAILGLPIERVQEIIEPIQNDDVVSIANHNTELQIVITGAPEPVERVSALAAKQGARAIPLKVSGAWHSELIRGAENEFKEFLDAITFNAPQSPVVFNVTGDFETDPAHIKSNMAEQVCSPVKWYDTMRKIIAEEVEVFAEVGPGRVLSGLIKKTLPRDYPNEIYSVNNLKTLEKLFKTAT